MRIRIGTEPSMPSTTRTIRGWSSRIGIESVIRTDSVGGVEIRLEHEAAGPISALDRDDLPFRRDLPEPVVLGAEERREAGVRVEPGEARPVDRTVVAHEDSRMEVPDKPVILDADRQTVPPLDECPVLRKARPSGCFGKSVGGWPVTGG